MTYALKTFNTGQITLPKKWRDRVGTKTFIAEERPEGLLIRPVGASTEWNVVYYESKDGFGLYSENGIDPETIIRNIKSLSHG